LVLADRLRGSEETVDAAALFLMIGGNPHTEWLPSEVKRDGQGFVLTGTDLPDDRTWPLARNPFLLETSMPRVFAAGGCPARLGEARGVCGRRGLGRGSAAP
jgi:thioredoxin reductase (NADPH)